MTKRISYLLLVMTALLAACGGTPKSNDKSGAVELIAQTQDALTQGDVGRVTLTVSASDIATPIVNDLIRSGAHWIGTVGGIPTGTERSLHADAFDASGNVVYRGDARHVTIDTDATVVVALLLQQASPPTPFANAVPVIDSFVASSNAIAPSHTVTLATTAHDPDSGDTLTFAWSATGGSFSANGAAATVWTAPATEGAQTLTIQVSDPHGAVAAMSLTVSVANANGSGTANVTVDLNTWPTVAGVIPSPTRIDVGGTSSLALSTADADGDTLGHAWASACAGAFDDASTKNPRFTIAGPIATASCAITVTVTDGRGGSNTGTVTLQTGPGAPVLLTPQVDNTYQSSPSARTGDVLTFRVRAHSPQGSALTFTWSASTGTVGTPTTTAGESDVTWTAPAACQASPMTLSATITDAAGLVTVQKFSITSDVTSDPNNCGTCGTSCGGFSCQAGTCNFTLGFKLMDTPALTRVYAGNDQVWGLDSATPGALGSAYQFNGSQFVGRNADRFALTMGGNGDVWALGLVNGNPNAVLEWNGNTFALQNGSLTEITEGTNFQNLWGLNGTTVYHFALPDGFAPVAGATLAHVVAGGSQTWGLDPSGVAVQWSAATSAFVSTGASFASLYVTQSGVAWGIDASGKASFWNGTSFTATNQAASRIAGGNDGTTWSLAGGVASAWNGTSFAVQGKAPVGTITEITVGRADNIWGVDVAAKRTFLWTKCVLPGTWSSSPSFCCSTAWSSPNVCA